MGSGHRHIVDLAKKIRFEEESNKELGSELKIAQEKIDRINKELEQISQEHETYLSDLISSHTEFDRALEIFQYHEIPMVLVDDLLAIHDANDTFCTLYSINRSELTSAFPPLHNILMKNCRHVHARMETGMILFTSLHQSSRLIMNPVHSFFLSGMIG